MAPPWVLADRTRVEDAARTGVAPANLRTAPPPPPPPPADRARPRSEFLRGVGQLRWQLLRVRRLWT
jgi:hypothetical protein